MADLATAVTAELDNFLAASDFPTPHFEAEDCGETAFRVIEHAKNGAILTGDTMYNVQQDMAAHGYSTQGGTVMSQLVAYFSTVRGLDVVEANAYGSSWDAIHQTLLAHAGRDGIVIEVQFGSKLTSAEQGVNRHYVAIGGIHPVRGYLVANGDTLAALAGAPGGSGHGRIIPAIWMDQNVLGAAVPCACAVIRGLSYTTDLSAGAVAAPQMVLGAPELGLAGARIVDGSLAPSPAPAPAGDPASSASDPSPETSGDPADSAAGGGGLEAAKPEELSAGEEPGAVHITIVSNTHTV